MTTQETPNSIWELPALAPPEGVVPNFVDPENLAYTSLWIVLLVIATVFVWVRMYTKIRITKKAYLEDYALSLAWLVYAAPHEYYLFQINALPGGVHQWNIKFKVLVLSLKLYNYATLCYYITVFLLKTSIILQYIRVFVPRGVRNLTYWACYALLTANAVVHILLIFLNAFVCIPVEAVWDLTIKAKYIVILILPQMVIWRLLVMKRKEKWRLSVVFLIGVFACILSIIRLSWAIILHRSPDMSYYMGLVGMLSELEIVCGFVAASAPVLPKFFEHVRSSTPWTYCCSMYRHSFGTKTGVPDSIVQKQVSETKRSPPGIITDIEFHRLVVEAAEKGAVSKGGIDEP